MKHTKYLFIILSLLLAINVSKARSLSEIISNPDLNYFQMLEQVEENKATLLDNADEGVQKRYYRWQTFWDSRVDEKGSFETYGNQLSEYSKNYVPNKSSNNYWESLGPNFSNLTHKDYVVDHNWDYKHIGRVECIWVAKFAKADNLIASLPEY